MLASPVWLNGDLVDRDHAVVSAFDHGMTVGDGVFETMKVVEGVPFALTRHLRRLHRSADGLGLVLPFDDLALATACGEVAAAIGTGPGRLRLTATGGAGPLGSHRGEAPATVMIAVEPATRWASTAAVVTVPWARNEHGALTGLKTTSYGENVVALAHAASRGADEAVFANTGGWLCEGTGTNVFVVSDGRLRTPTLASGCLAGITRELVCELVSVEATDDLTLDDLRHADEAFLTSSTRDVQPIATVDGERLPAAPGPVTEAAARAFAALQAETMDP